MCCGTNLRGDPHSWALGLSERGAGTDFHDLFQRFGKTWVKKCGFTYQIYPNITDYSRKTMGKLQWGNL
jgi:hypothetical protein